MEWRNYGDVNPLEHGGMWLMKDTEVSGNCYYAVKWERIDSGEFGLMAYGYVDISDNWIDWQGVVDYTDLNDESSNEELARAAFEYYGAAEFGGNAHIMTDDEALAYLHDREIFTDEPEEEEHNEEQDILSRIEASMMNPYPNEDYEDDIYSDIDEDIDEE